MCDAGHGRDGAEPVVSAEPSHREAPSSGEPPAVHERRRDGHTEECRRDPTGERVELTHRGLLAPRRSSRASMLVSSWRCSIGTSAAPGSGSACSRLDRGSASARSSPASSARDCLAAAYDAGVNFFDNAEVYAGGRSETIMGEAIAELGWPRHTLRHLEQVLLGHRGLGQHAEHAQSQVPAPRGRRIAAPSRPRLPRPHLLPPTRSRDADRGDGAGDARHHQLRSRAVLGDVGVERRRRSPRRGTSPIATTCTSR